MANIIGTIGIKWAYKWEMSRIACVGSGQTCERAQEVITYIIQWVKKLSQYLAILERVVCNKSNKLHKNVKIIYVIV